MEQSEKFPKNVLESPKISHLVPKIKPLSFSLDEQKENTSEEVGEEFLENSSTECNSDK